MANESFIGLSFCRAYQWLIWQICPGAGCCLAPFSPTRDVMRKLKLAMVLAGALGAGFALSGAAQAAPASAQGAAIGDAATTLSVVEHTQYVYGGVRHCWYRSGWHGAGWYRCGYQWRRGLGWGGVAGWNGWAAPGVVVAPAPVVVVPGPYFYNGRHYAHRRWRGGRWYYY
jgi:hypothetical protein